MNCSTDFLICQEGSGEFYQLPFCSEYRLYIPCSAIVFFINGGMWASRPTHKHLLLITFG